MDDANDHRRYRMSRTLSGGLPILTGKFKAADSPSPAIWACIFNPSILHEKSKSSTLIHFSEASEGHNHRLEVELMRIVTAHIISYNYTQVTLSMQELALLA